MVIENLWRIGHGNMGLNYYTVAVSLRTIFIFKDEWIHNVEKFRMCFCIEEVE